MAQRASILLLVAALLAAGGVFARCDTALAASPSGILTGYGTTTWGQKDGLPSAVIWALAQDRAGYLWLGTNTGLVRFDGVRFTEWAALSDAPLRELPIRALLAAGDALWVGYAEPGGVSRIADGKVQHYGSAEGLPAGLVATLVEDSAGQIWAGTREGLSAFANNRWSRPAGGLPPGPAHSAHLAADGTLLVGTGAGLFRRGPDDQEFRQTGDIANLVRHVIVDRSNRTWVTDPINGFRAVDDTRPAARPVDAGRGIRLLHDRHRNLWVGTGGQGLWRVPPASEAIEKTTALTGLSNDAIQCLLEDREGNIWVATLDGLNRLTPHKVSQVVDAGLVSGVQATADGSVWIGNIDSLIQFVDGKLHQRRVPQTVAGPPLSAMHADAAGVLWVATASGLSRIAHGHRESIALPHPFPGRPVAAIAADGEGGVWLSDLEHRVVRWTHGRSEALKLPAGIGDVRIMSIHGDRQGRLWLALADGRLAMAERSGHVAVHGSTDGLQAGVYGSLLEDRSGTVWLGGTEGLSRLVKGRFETLSRTTGFPGGSLIAILEDDAGRLWIALEGVGVVRIAKTELERAFEAPTHRVRFRLYDRSDGVAGTPQGYGNSSAARASDGRLWFVSGRGATVFDPATLDDAPESPLPVHIESVVLNGQRLSRALSTTLPSTTTQLEVAYTVLNLTSPLRTQFRYRLDGFDADWIEAGARRQAFYTNLPPGNYHFRVMAGDQEHGWNEPAASIWSFAVTPAFHQTTWFYVAAFAVAGLTIGAAWRFRLAQVRKQFSLVLGERARLSREIHDTLLQSMVGIALRFDAMAKDLEPSQSATRDELVRIRRDVEDYIREARQSIWDLRSPKLAKHDLATALREAGEHAVDGHPITFDLVVTGTPRRAEGRVEEQLLRIGQEAILNAIRHSGASRISMELLYEEQTIVVRVSDDGGGFDYGQARARSDGHFGLSSMQERADDVGAAFSIVSAPGRGTQVEAVVQAPAGH